MTDQTAFEAFAARDPWKEARDKSSDYQGSILWRVFGAILRFLAPKVFPQFGAVGRLTCVDLNKYRPDVNVEMLIDQGVRVFMLRVGGPSQWVYDNWKYEVDSTFVPYYDRIRAYAKAQGVVVWIIGYGVHNPFLGQNGNYLGLDPQVRWLKEATRNQICDAYCWDDEVATCWSGGKEVTITPANLVKSMRLVMEQTYLEMEKHASGLRKMIIHYSANWFMQRYAKADYQAWLDTVNRDVENRHLMTWRAWLPTVFSAVFATIGELFDKVISPTGIQENAFLRMGSELAADLWQCSFTAKGPWCGKLSAAGIDVSIGYGPSATIQQFAYNANLPLTVTPPVDPPPDPTVDLEALREDLHNRINAAIDAAKEK